MAKSVDKALAKRVEFATEMAESGRVYAASTYASPDGERDLLVFFPTDRGAYWLVRGKLAPSIDEKMAEAVKQRGTWKQGPRSQVPWMPNPVRAPKLQPEGMSLMHWLGEMPLVWFVNKEYAGG